MSILPRRFATPKLSRGTQIFLISLVSFLIALNVLLPILVKNFINDKLGHLPEYRGHVESVYLEIWRGAFRLHDFKIEKLNHEVATPFVDIAIIDSTLNWHALFHGRIVAKVGLIDPKVNFVDGPTPQTSQSKVPIAWQDALKNLVPIDLDVFWIRNGEVHFRNFQSRPPVDLYLEKVRMTAHNLTNAIPKGKQLFSDVSFQSTVMKTGTLHLEAKLDPLAEPPTVDAKGAIQHIRLQDLNPFFLAYGKFDVQSGEFDLFSETTTDKGKLEGYVKPFMRQTIVLGNYKEKMKEEEKAGVKPSEIKANPIWETLIAATLAIFKNHPRNYQAARIPFHGDLSHVKVDIWPTIWSVVTNSFIKPEKPGIENSQSLAKLKADEKKEAEKKEAEKKEKSKK